MAKTVAQINRELAQLKAQSQELGKGLEELYGHYLDELSQVAYQQLISVCYQLCTQFYPDLFLKLSFKERDQLQCQIKQQGQALKRQLNLEHLFQPDALELEALEAALIDGLELTPGSEPESETPELATLEIPGLAAQSSSSSGPASPSSDLHAPDLNLSGLALSEASNRADDDQPENQDQENQDRESQNPLDNTDVQTDDVQTEPPAAQTEENPFESLSDESFSDESLSALLSEPAAETSADASLERNDDSSSASSGQDSPRQLPITLIQTDEKTLSPGMLASAIAAEAEDDASDRPTSRSGRSGGGEAGPPTPPDMPQELLRWQERLERTISQRLRQSSQRMTRLLEKSGVLNNQLPDGLLAPPSEPEQSSEAEESVTENRRQRRPEQGSSRSPHILTLMLEPAGGKKGKSKLDPIQIVAIYLRLAEIEFETPLVMGWRNRIRGQVKTLKQLVREYEQTERERAIAEAEDAWRSTWSNE